MQKISHFYATTLWLPCLALFIASTSYPANFPHEKEVHEKKMHASFNALQNALGDVLSLSNIHTAQQLVRRKKATSVSNALKECFDLKEQVSIFLTDDAQKKSIERQSITKELGHGGSKKVYQSENKALFIPNGASSRNRWPAIVKEEVGMSQLCRSYGLLCSEHKKVFIKLNEHHTWAPTFISDSWDTLTQKNIYVCEATREDAPWPEDVKLFASEQESNNLKKWRPVLNALLTDIATIIRHGLPYNGDSVHMALVQNSSEYQIRYFGFDYSRKDSELTMPKLNSGKHLSASLQQKQAEYAFKKLVRIAYEHECKRHGYRKTDLIEQLATKFVPEILKRI